MIGWVSSPKSMYSQQIGGQTFLKKHPHVEVCQYTTTCMTTRPPNFETFLCQSLVSPKFGVFFFRFFSAFIRPSILEFIKIKNDDLWHSTFFAWLIHSFVLRSFVLFLGLSNFWLDHSAVPHAAFIRSYQTVCTGGYTVFSIWNTATDFHFPQKQHF